MPSFLLRILSLKNLLEKVYLFSTYETSYITNILISTHARFVPNRMSILFSLAFVLKF